MNNFTTPMTAYSRVVVGEAAAETGAIQVLSLALNQSAQWVADHFSDMALKPTVAALLGASGKTVALGSILGPETPTEIFALAAWNTFELYLRLKHLLVSHNNCQTWREEAASDLLEVYEGLLKLDMAESDRAVFKAEIEEVKKHVVERGLQPTEKLMPVRKLARAAHLEDEYDAYYKICSKFVHPSSFWVNFPMAASTPMYRAVFVFKLQLYGQLILDELETIAGLPVAQVIGDAQMQFKQLGAQGKTLIELFPSSTKS